MQTINNVATQDAYVEALTLGPIPTAQKVAYLVANNAAIVQIAGHSQAGTVQPWSQEILVTPTTGEFQRIQGMRFKSAIPGVPARVVAQLVEPDDPLPIGGTPFTAQLSAAGSVSTGVIVPTVTLANFPPANPVDGQMMELILPAAYDQATSKTLRWLVVYDATNAIWQVKGGDIHKQDATHTYTYVGAGVFTDPSSVLTGVTPITVPRPGLYKVHAECQGQDPATGGAHVLDMAVLKNGVQSQPLAEFTSVTAVDWRGHLSVTSIVSCGVADTLALGVQCGVNNVVFTQASIDVEALYLT